MSLLANDIKSLRHLDDSQCSISLSSLDDIKYYNLINQLEGWDKTFKKFGGPLQKKKKANNMFTNNHKENFNLTKSKVQRGRSIKERFL